MQGEWYMIATRCTSEGIACDWLRNVMSADTYYPVAKHSVSNGAIVERAAFPGYVYAKWEFTPNWDKMRYCSSIFKLMQYLSGDEEMDGIEYPIYEPLKFTDACILDLQKRQMKGDFDRINDNNPLLKKLIGTLIMIPYGTFRGKSGKVRQIENNNVIVTIKILGKQTRFVFPFDDLFGVVRW